MPLTRTCTTSGAFRAPRMWTPFRARWFSGASSARSRLVWLRRLPTSASGEAPSKTAPVVSAAPGDATEATAAEEDGEVGMSSCTPAPLVRARRVYASPGPVMVCLRTSASVSASSPPLDGPSALPRRRERSNCDSSTSADKMRSSLRSRRRREVLEEEPGSPLRTRLELVRLLPDDARDPGLRIEDMTLLSRSAVRMSETLLSLLLSTRATWFMQRQLIV
mmetsp:Transcript_5991/g.19079  ORF Transcript_5991/g.19079 Transcript_5991/m.19079 type:complete len:221 (-) Transcript_5991:236-898(-)